MRSRRHVLCFGLAAVLALATARVVARDLAALHRRAARLGPGTPVVVARRDLPLGATVTAGDVEVRHLHEPPPRGVRQRRRAVGRTVAVPVLAGAPVQAGNLIRRGALVQPGTRVVRVKVDPAWPVVAGSVVDVLAPSDTLGTGEELATVVARGAVVVAREDSEARGSGGVPREVGAMNAGEVTLLVTVESARRLASAGAATSLVLALAPPEDACCGTFSWASSRG